MMILREKELWCLAFINIIRHYMDDRLLKNTLIYAVGNFGTKILSFLIVPLYTHYIRATDMGIYDLFITAVSFITPFVTLQLTDGIYRWLINENVDKETVIKSCFYLMKITSIITVAVLFVFKLCFHLDYAITMLLLLLSTAYYTIMLQITRGLSNNKLYSCIGIINTACFLSLNVLQVIILKQGIRGLLYSQIIANIFSLIVMITVQPILRNTSSYVYSKKILEDMLRYSVPLIPNCLSWSVIDASDRFFIIKFLGAGANGIYAISHKFPSVIQMFTSFFYLSWQDMVLSDLKNDDDSYTSNIFESYYRFLFSGVMVLIPITDLFIKIVMDIEYADSWKYTGILYLATAFSALASFLGTGYNVSKKSERALFTTIIAAAVNLIVNLSLIKSFGLYAASISTLISYMVLLKIRIKDTKDMLILRIDQKKLFLMALVALSYAILYLCFAYTILNKIWAQLIAMTLFVIWNKKWIFKLTNRLLKGGKK